MYIIQNSKLDDNEEIGLFYFHRYFGGIPLRISYTKDLSWYIKILLSVICLEKVIYGIFILLIVLKTSSISFWKKALNNFIITGTWTKMTKSLEFQPSPFYSLSYIFIPEQFRFLNTHSINFHFANFLLLLYLIIKIVNITINLIITIFMITLINYC